MRPQRKEYEAEYRERNRDRLREYQRNWKRKRREQNPDYFRDYYSQYHKARRKDPSALAQMFIGKAEKRAIEQGWDFDLWDHKQEIAERMGMWRCELTGIRLVSAEGQKQINSISIDRIDSDQGYVYENIRIIAWGLNAAFSNWGEEDTAKLMLRWLDRRMLI